MSTEDWRSPAAYQYAATMEPLADGVLTEQCNEYGTCSALSSYFGH